MQRGVRGPAGSCVATEGSVRLFGNTVGEDQVVELTGIPDGHYHAFLIVPGRENAETEDFNRVWITKYTAFLQNFRKTITEQGAGSTENHVLVLSKSDSRPYDVLLYTPISDWTIFRFERVDMYLKGFRTNKGKFRFVNHVCDPQDEWEPLRFGSTYSNLTGTSECEIENLTIGMGSMATAVDCLVNYEAEHSDKGIAAALLVCVIMVAEAGRFDNIGRLIVDAHENGFNYYVKLPGYVGAYFNKWATISKCLIRAKSGDQRLIERANTKIARLMLTDGEGQVNTVEKMKGVMRVLLNKE